MALTVTELYCVAPFGRWKPAYWVAPFLHFGAAVGTGLFIAKHYYGQAIDSEPIRRASSHLSIALLVWAVGLVGMGCYAQHIFTVYSLDSGQSDILPTIQVAVTRYLRGEFPYRPIDLWGYRLPLTYLPAQWMPYIGAALLHIDYRWMACLLFAIGGTWVIVRSRPNNRITALGLPFLLVFSLWLLVRNNNNILASTVELMVAGYYMMLIMGLAGKNGFIRGLVIALCLLSRYSLVLWLPLWAVSEFLAGDRRQLLVSLLTTGALVLAFYIVPFLMHDPGIFLEGYHYYSKAALGEWEHLNEFQRPYHLYNGQGFAWIFYGKLQAFPVTERIKWLQQTHVVCCIGSTIVMGAWYWVHRKQLDLRIFLLASFKIYLAIFLAFIQVPYAYLMISGVFVSIAILAQLSRYKAVVLADDQAN